MNYTTAIFLINKNARGIQCVFDPTGNDEADAVKQRYLFKTLDPSIKKGDLVVVPAGSRDGGKTYNVVKVVETDVDPDYDSSINYKWIIDVVNTKNYFLILAQEEEAIVEIKKAEVLRRRKDLTRDLEDHFAQVKVLAIADMNGKDEEPFVKKAKKD